MHGAKSRRKSAKRSNHAAALGALGGLAGLAALFTGQVAWAADAGPNHVRDVKVVPAEGVPGGADIQIVGTSAPTYNVRVAEGGKRLYVDLSNSDVIGAPAALTDAVGVVGGVLTQAFKTESGSIARLNVSLAKNATFRVKVEGNTLHVLLSPAGANGTTGVAPTSTPTNAPTTPTTPATQSTAPAGAQDQTALVGEGRFRYEWCRDSGRLACLFTYMIQLIL